MALTTPAGCALHRLRQGMRQALIIVLAMGGLWGCASKWYHPAKTEQQFHADKAACSAQAGQSSGANDPYGIIWARTFRSCMLGQGWTQVTE